MSQPNAGCSHRLWPPAPTHADVYCTASSLRQQQAAVLVMTDREKQASMPKAGVLPNNSVQISLQ